MLRNRWLMHYRLSYERRTSPLSRTWSPGLSQRGPGNIQVGAKPDHKLQGTCEARCTVAEPSSPTGILIANSPIMTRLLVADGGVALNYVLTSDSVSKQVNLAIIF